MSYDLVKKIDNITQLLRHLDASENELSGLTAGHPRRETLAQQIFSLRALIPTAILTHHDRMKARGKPSVVPIRNGVCGACHIAIPKGNLIRLRDPNELNVCDCGAFIYLSDEDAASFDRPPAPKEKKPAARKKKPSAAC